MISVQSFSMIKLVSSIVPCVSIANEQERCQDIFMLCRNSSKTLVVITQAMSGYVLVLRPRYVWGRVLVLSDVQGRCVRCVVNLVMSVHFVLIAATPEVPRRLVHTARGARDQVALQAIRLDSDRQYRWESLPRYPVHPVW